MNIPVNSLDREREWATLLFKKMVFKERSLYDGCFHQFLTDLHEWKPPDQGLFQALF